MKYIVYIFSLVWLTCLFASCSSKHAHFISDSTYRARVEQDFQQKQVVMSKGNLFAIFDTDLTLYEREALEFLYAYMPLADITDYSDGFHLMNVQAAHRASEEMPWGRMVSEELFRHFVLPVRVNNEPLDSARVVFYEELKPRVQHLSMRNAILEVNHWCHEKAVYQPSDARTSSPLATVRTAYGRCGEEWLPCAQWAFPRARSILPVGHIPTTIMPGWKPGLTANGTSSVPVSLSRCLIWDGSTRLPAAAC